MFLEHHANTRPEQTALLIGNTAYSYRQFHTDARLLTEALMHLGVSSGNLVLVSHSDLYIEWLLLIACENIGAASASFPNGDLLVTLGVNLRASFVFSDMKPSAWSAHTIFTIANHAWLESVRQSEHAANSANTRFMVFPNDALRVTYSSGTTGVPKAMVLKRNVQEARIKALWQSGDVSSDTRVLLTMPLSVNSAYVLAQLCLRLGALIISAPLSPANIHRATYLEIMPYMLHKLLNELPHNFIRSQKLALKVIGAPLTKQHYTEAVHNLCTHISCRYATNELWPIATDMDTEQVGTISDDVEVIILDDNGNAVEQNKEGRIAVRSPNMVEGYLYDPEATNTYFKNGFFITGDYGRLLPEGKLKLEGRCDDVLNCGGLKIHPKNIEENIQAIAGVIEVAATSTNVNAASDNLYITCVLKQGVRVESILSHIDKVTVLWRHVWVNVVDALPRTGLGKLDRVALRRFCKTSDTTQFSETVYHRVKANPKVRNCN